MLRIAQFEQRGRTASQRLFFLRQFSHAAPDCSLLLGGVTLVMFAVVDGVKFLCIKFAQPTGLGEPEIYAQGNSGLNYCRHCFYSDSDFIRSAIRPWLH